VDRTKQAWQYPAELEYGAEIARHAAYRSCKIMDLWCIKSTVCPLHLPTQTASMTASEAIPLFGQASKVVGYLFTLTILYCTSTIVYNLYFSPLSKFPGSWIYTSTRLPRVWLYITGREPWVIADMHKRYGPIVRVAPNELSFIDEAAWKDIYGIKNNNPKDETQYPFSPETKKSLILANDEDHHMQRKMFLPAFSARALRDQNDLLSGYVVELVRVLDEKRKTCESVDLVKYYNFTT